MVKIWEELGERKNMVKIQDMRKKIKKKTLIPGCNADTTMNIDKSL